MSGRRTVFDPELAGERLNAEDMAARRADEFLLDALTVQEIRARGGDVIQSGVCSNCGVRCAAGAFYCDDDCKRDHLDRVTRQARQRRSLG